MSDSALAAADWDVVPAAASGDDALAAAAKDGAFAVDDDVLAVVDDAGVERFGAAAVGVVEMVDGFEEVDGAAAFEVVDLFFDALAVDAVGLAAFDAFFSAFFCDASAAFRFLRSFFSLRRDARASRVDAKCVSMIQTIRYNTIIRPIQTVLFEIFAAGDVA